VNFKKILKFELNFKNIVFVLTVCFVVFFIIYGQGVFAEKIDPVTSLENTAKTAGLVGDNPESDITIIIAHVVNLVLGFLGIIFLILVIYGGFMRMTAAGDADKIKKSMKIITSAAIGVFIILAAYAITNFVFNNIEKSVRDQTTYEIMEPDLSSPRTGSGGGVDYEDEVDSGDNSDSDSEGINHGVGGDSAF